MKKLVLLLIFFVSVKVLSQKNFEGIVVYQTFQHGITSKMTMFFGQSKIKIVSTITYEDSLQKINQTYGGVYDFVKGTLISYSSFTERYEIDTLNNEKEEDELAVIERKDSSITVAGFACNKLFFNVDTSNKTRMSKNYMWYSDKLKYVVPVEYRNKLSISPDGNMLWLASTNILSYYNPLQQAIRIDTTATNAISIQKKKLKNSHFSIPRNYKLDDGSSTWDVISRQYEKSLKSTPKKTAKQKSGNN